MGIPAWSRGLLLAVGGALLGFLLLCAYAAPRAGLGWSAEAQQLDATRFGGGTAEGGALRITRVAGAPQHLLALESAEPLRGRFLSYRFDPLPAELRLLLGWRNAADGPWTWKPLPAADGAVTVDLARLSGAWTGEAAALAFLLLPAELLAADAVPAQALRFHGARLESDARGPAIAALLDEWRAAGPWSGRSINTGGFDQGMDRPRPLQGFVLAGALAAALLLLASRLLRRAPGRPAQALLVVLVAAWLLLDLAQLRLLAQRSVALASLDRASATPLAIHPPLARSLATVRNHPALAQGRRVAVLAPDSFLRTWPVFELLPRDAAPLLPGQLPQLPAGVLLLHLGGGDYRPGSGVLRAGGHAVPVRELHLDPQLQLLETMPPAGATP